MYFVRPESPNNYCDQIEYSLILIWFDGKFHSKMIYILMIFFMFDFLAENMNSAAKVGEIFTKAGETFHKLADMTVMLDPVAQELNNQPKTSHSVSTF